MLMLECAFGERRYELQPYFVEKQTLNQCLMGAVLDVGIGVLTAEIFKRPLFVSRIFVEGSILLKVTYISSEN